MVCQAEVTLLTELRQLLVDIEQSTCSAIRELLCARMFQTIANNIPEILQVPHFPITIVAKLLEWQESPYDAERRLYEQFSFLEAELQPDSGTFVDVDHQYKN